MWEKFYIFLAINLVEIQTINGLSEGKIVLVTLNAYLKIILGPILFNTPVWINYVFLHIYAQSELSQLPVGES